MPNGNYSVKKFERGANQPEERTSGENPQRTGEDQGIP